MGVKVVSKRNENIESLLRRFKKSCDNADVIKDYKKHSVYEKPSDRRKREAVMRRKNSIRKMREPRVTKAAKFVNL